MKASYLLCSVLLRKSFLLTLQCCFYDLSPVNALSGDNPRCYYVIFAGHLSRCCIVTSHHLIISHFDNEWLEVIIP